MFQSVDQMNKVQIHSEMSSMFDVWAGPALAPGLHSNLNVMETLKSPNGSQLTVSQTHSLTGSQSHRLTVSQAHSLQFTAHSLTVSQSPVHSLKIVHSLTVLQSHSLTVSQSYSLTVSSSQSHILLDILNLLTETKIIFKIV